MTTPPLVYTRWEGTELFNYSSLIYANSCENIAITGSGTIDGNAQGVYKGWFGAPAPDQERLRTMGDKATPEKRIFGKGHYLRPSFIQFINCERIKIEGIKIIESHFGLFTPFIPSTSLFAIFTWKA